MTYQLRYLQDETSCKFGENSLFPKDGRIIPSCRTSGLSYSSAQPKDLLLPDGTFTETGVFTVSANSEGYILLDLPPTNETASKVVLAVEKYVSPYLRSSEQMIGASSQRMLVLNREITSVSVEITDPINNSVAF